MSAVPKPTFYFDTDPTWIDIVREWASSVPDVERVWIFGSRATGIRRSKHEQSPTPDLDVAYTLSGSDETSLYGLAVVSQRKWFEWLQRRIPVSVHLQFAQTTDEYVWPAVQTDGILIFDRAEER